LNHEAAYAKKMDASDSGQDRQPTAIQSTIVSIQSLCAFQQLTLSSDVYSQQYLFVEEPDTWDSLAAVHLYFRTVQAERNNLAPLEARLATLWLGAINSSLVAARCYAEKPFFVSVLPTSSRLFIPGVRTTPPVVDVCRRLLLGLDGDLSCTGMAWPTVVLEAVRVHLLHTIEACIVAMCQANLHITALNGEKMDITNQFSYAGDEIGVDTHSAEIALARATRLVEVELSIAMLVDAATADKRKKGKKRSQLKRFKINTGDSAEACFDSPTLFCGNLLDLATKRKLMGACVWNDYCVDEIDTARTVDGRMVTLDEFGYTSDFFGEALRKCELEVCGLENKQQANDKLYNEERIPFPDNVSASLCKQHPVVPARTGGWVDLEGYTGAVQLRVMLQLKAACCTGTGDQPGALEQKRSHAPPVSRGAPGMFAFAAASTTTGPFNHMEHDDDSNEDNMFSQKKRPVPACVGIVSAQALMNSIAKLGQSWIYLNLKYGISPIGGQSGPGPVAEKLAVYHRLCSVEGGSSGKAYAIAIHIVLSVVVCLRAFLGDWIDSDNDNPLMTLASVHVLIRTTKHSKDSGVTRECFDRVVKPAVLFAETIVATIEKLVPWRQLEISALTDLILLPSNRVLVESVWAPLCSDVEQLEDPNARLYLPLSSDEVKCCQLIGHA
jgi:hypothetical protein